MDYEEAFEVYYEMYIAHGKSEEEARDLAEFYVSREQEQEFYNEHINWQRI